MINRKVKNRQKNKVEIADGNLNFLSICSQQENQYSGGLLNQMTPPTASSLMVALHEQNIMRRARRNMLNHQILAEGITDAHILNAFGITPREHFVPEKYKSLAYMDEEIALGHGRFLLRASRAAKLLQVAQITQEMQVMVIPGDVGYFAMLVSYLAEEVVIVDSYSDLLKIAQDAYKEFGITNVIGVHGMPENGYAQAGPYDRIILTERISEVPHRLLSQLAEHGKLYAVIEKENAHTLTEFGRSEARQFYARELEEMVLPPLSCREVQLNRIY